jgi:hypothetical protein
MKRTALAGVVLAALGGCMSDGGHYIGETWNSGAGAVPGAGPGCLAGAPPTIPGAQGAWGQPVPVRGVYAAAPPTGETAAKAMIATNMPLDLVQQVGYKPGSVPPGLGGVMPAGGATPPPGSVTPPGVPDAPGGVPPLTGVAPGFGAPPGAVAAVGALTGPHAGPFAAARTSVHFVAPAGMKVSWYVNGPDGRRVFSPTPLEVPGTYNFAQAAIYRLKLSDLPDQPGVDLYPTLDVVPASPKAAAFLAHSSVPVSFTADDFRMVASGNYIVKVIYLPDPAYQDVAVTGTGELISTQLEPGVDPITEACKRGSILLVVRLGNIDLELRHSPAMDAPPPHAAAAPPPGVMPPVGSAAGAPGPMAPYGMIPGRGMGPAGPAYGNPATMPNPGLPPAPGMPAPQASGALPPLPPTAAQMAGQGGR